MNRNYLRIFTPAILIFPLVAGAAFAVPASAADTRYITISATGTTTVVPDAVRINATVSVLSSTSKEARTISSSTAAALRASLAKNGVVTKDIATQSLTIYPEYSYPTSGTPTLSGYRASQSFDITIRKASTAGTVVDAIVESGGDNLQINGVSPFVLDNNKATETARTYAVGRAKARTGIFREPKHEVEPRTCLCRHDDEFHRRETFQRLLFSLLMLRHSFLDPSTVSMVFASL
jgi:uncharacterized protein YggE